MNKAIRSTNSRLQTPRFKLYSRAGLPRCFSFRQRETSLPGNRTLRRTMKRLLQVFDWFLYAFGLAGLAAMTTLAVIMPPHWPIFTALLLTPRISTAVLLLAPTVVRLLARIA